MTKKSVAFAYGDGIGPEIMEAVLAIMREAGCPFTLHEVAIGEKVYREGIAGGIPPSTWEILRRTDAFLKAPITTPQGGGYKSLNVTVRTSLGLYANVRPCVAYAPFVPTKHPGMDLVIVRENEEDLYTGIEYQPTEEVCQAVKIITRSGSERVIRYAFEYALQAGRKKVTCFTKDNILKKSDGLFHKIFTEIAQEYPALRNEHWIVDIGAAKLADTPEIFDVIVLPNLYGDILSDVGAQIAGSVGMAGSANIGEHAAMFEAIHGSAPRQAGKNTANPSGLLLAAVMMYHHLGFSREASSIHNAWLKTIEEGIHTYDIHPMGGSPVGTREFAQAVIARLGKLPETLPTVVYHTLSPTKGRKCEDKLPQTKILVGVDVSIAGVWESSLLANRLRSLISTRLPLVWIANHGVKVWPERHPETFCIALWRCRFLAEKEVSLGDIVDLLDRLSSAEIPFTEIENLYLYNGEPGFSE